MSFKDYAHKLAQELEKNPTSKNVQKIAFELCSQTKSNGEKLSESDIAEILKLIEQEIGDLQVFFEQFDNKATLTVMDQMKKIIEETKKK